MMLFLSRFFALAAIAVWAPIVAGLLGWLFWPQVAVSVRGQERSSDDERDPAGARLAHGLSEVPSWEPDRGDPGFLPLDDEPLDA